MVGGGKVGGGGGLLLRGGQVGRGGVVGRLRGRCRSRFGPKNDYFKTKQSISKLMYIFLTIEDRQREKDGVIRKIEEELNI